MYFSPLCSVGKVRMLQRLFDIGSTGLVKGTLTLSLQATYCFTVFTAVRHDNTLEMEIHLHIWVASIVIF